MSITVSDCLKMQSLKNAVVLGGARGLDKIVSSVTVLEYAGSEAFTEELFLANEMVITGLISVKDDVSAQCEAMRCLHDQGVAALILFYLGVFLEKVDRRLLDIADQLAFPLILMPPNQFNLRYGEVITEVMYAIFSDQKKDELFATDMLVSIGQLKDHQRTIYTVLRMLSDRTRCSLLLTNNSGSQIAFAAWPLAAGQEYAHIQEYLSHYGPDMAGEECISYKDLDYHVLHTRVQTYDHKQLHLFALGYQEPTTLPELVQAGEVIRSFGDIWHCDFAQEGPEALITAILTDQDGDARHIAEPLGLDVNSLSELWLLFDMKPGLSPFQYRRRNADRCRLVKDLLHEHYLTVLADTTANTLVLMTGAPKYSLLEEGLDAQVMEALGDLGRHAALVHCPGQTSLPQLRASYMLAESNIVPAARIFPQRRCFSSHELQFAQTCMELLQQGDQGRGGYLQLLEPLLDDDGASSLLSDTLAVYLLDARSSNQLAGELLHLHKNTVKYRLNRIQQLVGYDISQAPMAINLYTAVALRRLLQEESKA